MSVGSMRTSRDDGSDRHPLQQPNGQVNTMGIQADPNHDMPVEIDFSKGSPGEFFRP